jgi:hypothetical protein
VASRGHFSDNGCASGASQAAEGQSIVSRGQFTGITVMYQGAEDEPKGSSVEWSPRLPRFDVHLRRCRVGQIKRQN